MMEPVHGIAGKQAIKGLHCICWALSWREGGVKHEAAECFGKAACFDKHEARSEMGWRLNNTSCPVAILAAS